MIKKLAICIVVLATSALVFFKLNGQSSFFHSVTGGDDIPEPDRLMGKIIDQSAQKISKKYGFLPIGVGLSGKFRRVGIDFRVYSPLNKDDARKILFDCAEIILQNINSSNEIQPYLEVKPFSIENVGITIYSTDKNYEHFPHPLLAVAKLGSLGLTFRTEEPGQISGYKEESEETFEEARAILNKNSAQ